MSEPLTHTPCHPLDPPGSTPRRWCCRSCGAVGDTIALLMATRCPDPDDSDAALLEAIEGDER